MLNKLNLYLFLFIPLALVTGPFIPDLIVSLIALSTLIMLLTKKIKINLSKSKFLLVLLIFYFYLLFNSLIISNEVYHSLGNSLFYFRFILFFVGINYLFQSNFELSRKLFIVLIFTCIIISIDAIAQYLIGVNSLGYQYRDGRLSGLFGKELIIGSYMMKFLPILITTYLLFDKNLNNKIKYLFFISFFMIFFVIIASGERAALLSLILFIFLSSFIYLSFKKLIFFLVAFISLLSIFILSNEGTKQRYFYDFKDEVFYESEKKNIYDYIPKNHSGLFQTSINIGKNNIIFGSGVNSFRFECSNYRPYVCNTHPHNTYLQIFSELGLVGLVFICILFLALFYKYLLIYTQRLKSNYPINTNVIMVIASIVSFFPIMTNGNFFNNYLSILYFITLTFTFNVNFKK